jgi:hypothetical protein
VYIGAASALGVSGHRYARHEGFPPRFITPHLERCVLDRDKDLFASELVIRAYRAGLDVREIPIRVVERRAPSINLLAHVPNVLRGLARLTWAIRLSRPAPARLGWRRGAETAVRASRVRACRAEKRVRDGHWPTPPLRSSRTTRLCGSGNSSDVTRKPFLSAAASNHSAVNRLIRNPTTRFSS